MNIANNFSVCYTMNDDIVRNVLNGFGQIMGVMNHSKGLLVLFSDKKSVDELLSRKTIMIAGKMCELVRPTESWYSILFDGERWKNFGLTLYKTILDNWL